MGRIHVLEKDIAQLIAAGEVVERPSSAIKELVENSIDAGSTFVTIEIKNGGVTYMRVSDNGCGISADDVKKVFLRHATSKIKDENDLLNIATLGFRGEAMASIHAVCRIELLTRTPDVIDGTRYTSEGGENTQIAQIGCPVGTTVIARDIFFNTPARMKFLKKDVSESSSISGIVEKMALSHPEISFKLIRDGQMKLHTPGDGKLLSAIMAVYGREFAHGVIPVEFSQGAISVTGYVSTPAATRSNRTMQNFFINGRYVKSRTAAAALEEAYKHSIMVGKFPACVLKIKMPFEEIDVNVHPSKIEVRFTNEKSVYDTVFYGIKNTLSQSDYKLNLNQNNSKQSKKLTVFDLEPRDEVEQVPLLNQSKSIQLKMNSKPSTGEHISAEEYRDINNKTLHTKQSKDKSTGKILSENDRKPSTLKEPRQPLSEKIQAKTLIKKQELPISKEERTTPDDQSQAFNSDEVRFIGEVFLTYIVLQVGTEMILIDKHAAHERLIFNKLKKQILVDDRQMLLEPIMVHLSREDYQGALGHMDSFKEVGFLVEDFGDGDLMVREVPTIIEQAEIPQIIEEISHSLALHKEDITPKVVDELLHSISCKSAIRGNDKTTKAELEQIVEMLRENEDVKYCPHGRPIAKIITKYEIEKMFGRV